MTSPASHSANCLDFGLDGDCPACHPQPICPMCEHPVLRHAYSRLPAKTGCPGCRDCEGKNFSSHKLNHTELRHQLLRKAAADELWWGNGSRIYFTLRRPLGHLDTGVYKAMKAQATTLRYHLMFLPPEGYGLEPLVLSPQGRLTLAIWDRLHPDTEKGV